MVPPPPAPSPVPAPAITDTGSNDARTHAATPSPRLLLVEDNPVNLLVAQKLLMVLGHACDTATNGEIALTRMADGNYDLVLMDCQMPVLDGYTATRRWRAHEATHTPGRRLPIIATTANAMAGDRQRCLDAGMDDYLSKPITRDQLEACLRRWLQPAPPSAPVPTPDLPSATRPAGPPPEVTSMDTPATNTPAPTAAVLDMAVLDELREIAGTEAQAIVRLFLEDAPRLAQQMEQACAAPDLEALREAAHALKSSSANVGALALSAAARHIELGARARTLDRPAAAVSLLVAELDRTRAALQGWLSADADPGQPSSLLNR